jgi:predicted NACHT family NTPase
LLIFVSEFGSGVSCTRKQGTKKIDNILYINNLICFRIPLHTYLHTLFTDTQKNQKELNNIIAFINILEAKLILGQMELALTDIKDLVTISKPIIDPIIGAIIKPQIEKLTKILSKNNKITKENLELKFVEYLTRTLVYCENINVLIFQNQQIKISDIYLPLTIQSAKDKISFLVDDFKSEYLDGYERILISDTAGMGKSTLAKFISLQIISNNLAIPILIELRNLKEDHNVLDEIFRQFNPIDESFDKKLIFEFLNSGKFIIILDGFDEIQLKSQEVIVKDLRDFISKTARNQFLLTSRPEGALASFGDV